MRQNAAQLNRMQIREQEALNRQRQSQDDAEARREAQALRRTQAQYDHVTSHGYGRGGAAGASPAGPSSSASGASAAAAASGGGNARRGSANAGVGQGDDVHIKVYVRECDEDAGQSFSYREGGSAVTRAAPASGGAPRAARSFAGSPAHPQQANPSVRASAPVGGGAKTDDAVAPNRARVPRYLQQRKAEMAAEKAAVAAEAELQRQLSQIPPGHRRVSEEEKADTLRRIDERQHELEAQLAKIPIRFDTQSIQQRRRAIEDELRELDTRRSKYSTKNPLYVPLG